MFVGTVLFVQRLLEADSRYMQVGSLVFMYSFFYLKISFFVYSVYCFTASGKIHFI